MGEKTRTVMLWYNRDEARLTLAVNPRQMTVTRTQEVRTFRTLTGEPVEISRGRGLRKVRFATFLPAPGSRFYQDITPQRALPNTYPVQPGDTLWRIARCLYGDGTRWRAIAVKNGLDSGVEPAAGQVLIL